MEFTAKPRAIKHHLSSGAAGRQRKEEIAEQLYLFGGSGFDFPTAGTPSQGEAVQCLLLFAHPS